MRSVVAPELKELIGITAKIWMEVSIVPIVVIAVLIAEDVWWIGCSIAQADLDCVLRASNHCARIHKTSPAGDPIGKTNRAVFQDTL